MFGPRKMEIRWLIDGPGWFHTTHQNPAEVPRKGDSVMVRHSCVSGVHRVVWVRWDTMGDRKHVDVLLEYLP